MGATSHLGHLANTGGSETLRGLQKSSGRATQSLDSPGGVSCLPRTLLLALGEVDGLSRQPMAKAAAAMMGGPAKG